MRFDCAAARRSARNHAAESRETSLPLSDQWVWSQIQQAAVIWNKQAVCHQASLCHPALQIHQQQCHRFWHFYSPALKMCPFHVSINFFFLFFKKKFILGFCQISNDSKWYLHRIQYKSIKKIKMIVELLYGPCFCICWRPVYLICFFGVTLVHAANTSCGFSVSTQPQCRHCFCISVAVQPDPIT